MLSQFLIVNDPNLTFLGLEALVALMDQRRLRKQAVEIYSSERQAVVNLFNSNDQCIQQRALTVMRQTVNASNIMQFVKDLVNKLPSRNSQNEASRFSQLNICSAIMQVCIQDNYKNLIVGDNLDERLSWFVVDVLLVLAESLAVSKDSSLNMNPKRTMQL